MAVRPQFVWPGTSASEFVAKDTPRAGVAPLHRACVTVDLFPCDLSVLVTAMYDVTHLSMLYSESVARTAAHFSAPKPAHFRAARQFLSLCSFLRDNQMIFPALFGAQDVVL